ncbi:hypothetical protein BDQ17DRAFT_1327989 [Cyathus striatus]|nr:hypothetical protein BDQ17DRAFT_1327989 [Cyathus striatus]
MLTIMHVVLSLSHLWVIKDEDTTGPVDPIPTFCTIIDGLDDTIVKWKAYGTDTIRIMAYPNAQSFCMKIGKHSKSSWGTASRDSWAECVLLTHSSGTLSSASESHKEFFTTNLVKAGGKIVSLGSRGFLYD